MLKITTTTNLHLNQEMHLNLYKHKYTYIQTTYQQKKSKQKQNQATPKTVEKYKLMQEKSIFYGNSEKYAYEAFEKTLKALHTHTYTCKICMYAHTKESHKWSRVYSDSDERKSADTLMQKINYKKNTTFFKK